MFELRIKGWFYKLWIALQSVTRLEFSYRPVSKYHCSSLCTFYTWGKA